MTIYLNVFVDICSIWTGNTALSNCQLCIPGAYQTGTGINSCMACKSGKYESLSGSTNCALCAAGKFFPSTGASSAAQCQACDANLFSPAGSGSCSADCPEGTYPSSEMECKYCDAGKYLTYRGSRDPLECQPCKAGTYSSTQGATMEVLCHVCSAGRYSWKGAVICSQCAAGTYQSGLGMTSTHDCLLCDKGKFATTRNAVEYSECKDCNVGSFSSGGQSTCVQCSVGSFQASKAASECIFCSAGKYADISGSIECKLCYAGSYSNLNTSVCTGCQSGKFSTAIGSGGSCNTWKKCKSFIEVEDDRKAPSAESDRVCIQFQYDPPKAVKIFIFFFQFLFCSFCCTLFLMFAPNICLAIETKNINKDMDYSAARLQGGCILQVFKTKDIAKILKALYRSKLIAPVQKSLLGAYHDFLIGTHDVVSDLSLLLLVSSEAPGFLFKNIRGDLFYVTLVAVLGSLLVDIVTAICCNELHLVWLYIASCTDIYPSRRGHITYLNKALKFWIETVPVWSVQSIFIYQTYMKYEEDQNALKISAANEITYNANLNMPSMTDADTRPTTNTDWWLDYGIVLISMLSSSCNIIKNIFSFRRMLQYKWNDLRYPEIITRQVLDTKYVLDSGEAVLCVQVLSPSSMLDLLAKTQKSPTSFPKLSENKCLGFFLQIKHIKSIQVLHLSKQSKQFIHFLDELFSSGATRLSKGDETELNYPVCAAIEVSRRAENRRDQKVGDKLTSKLRFIYVIEISGKYDCADCDDSVDNQYHGRSRLSSGDLREQCWNRVLCGPQYEIREYYYSDKQWIANERENGLVDKSVAAKKVHQKLVDLSLLQLYLDSKSTKEIFNHYEENLLLAIHEPDKEFEDFDIQKLKKSNVRICGDFVPVSDEAVASADLGFPSGMHV